MMGIGPEATEYLDLEEYEALLFHWNDAHGSGDEAPPAPPINQERARQIVDLINADTRLTGSAA